MSEQWREVWDRQLEHHRLAQQVESLSPVGEAMLAMEAERDRLRAELATERERANAEAAIALENRHLIDLFGDVAREAIARADAAEQACREKQQDIEHLKPAGSRMLYPLAGGQEEMMEMLWDVLFWAIVGLIVLFFVALARALI